MLRILASPFIIISTTIILPSAGYALFFLPLIFALSISLINFSKFKVNLILWGILLTIIQSYSVFIGLGITVYFADEYLAYSELMSNNPGLKGIILISLGGYFAALLLFYFFSFLMRIDNKRFSYAIISICYLMIIIVMQVFSKNEFLQFGVEKFTSFLISWMIFMSLGFGIALNRRAFMNFIERRS